MIIGAPQQLFDRAREVARVKHYSHKTEQAYLHWIRRFVAFHGRRNPLQMGEPVRSGPMLPLPQRIDG